MDGNTGDAVSWLLSSAEPAVRRLTRRDLLREGADGIDDVLEGAIVRALLSGQGRDGGFGVHPYRKWTGAHWRLVSLVELGIPASEPRAVRAAGTVLDWLTGEEHRASIVAVDGLARVHASQEGNALAVCSRLGLARDPRVEMLAKSLVRWQWPDGGWNCDPRATGRRSSFHESLAPAWGLHEYWQATGEPAARQAALCAAELFLEHRLFRSLGTGQVIRRDWLTLHYPPYWHYDILQVLLVLSRMQLTRDPRCRDAIAVLERRRRPDGRWQPGGYWWKPPGTPRGTVEVVDWGRSAPSEMITLNSLRILKTARASATATGHTYRHQADPDGRPQARKSLRTRLVDQIDTALRARGVPGRAEHERAYLKSELEHYGTSVPDIRSVAKAVDAQHPGLSRGDLLALVGALWAAPVHERRMAAVELLGIYHDRLRGEDIVLLERLLRESRTWALVDPLAASVAGRLAERYPELGVMLGRWAEDPDFWIRRAALLAFLGPLRRGDGDFERFARYADPMLDDKEFFVRKAIGWVLRDTARKRPTLVYTWLLPRAARASGVTVREAIKPLNDQQRAAIIAARAGSQRPPSHTEIAT
jgi:3-methyladenine DNA glycosylase AlkD